LHAEGAGIAAYLALDERLAQCFELLLSLFDQTQTLAHDFTGGAVASVADLPRDETFEVVAKSNAGVFSQRFELLDVPVDTTYW